VWTTLTRQNVRDQRSKPSNRGKSESQNSRREGSKVVVGGSGRVAVHRERFDYSSPDERYHESHDPNRCQRYRGND
jgi:hypothetical protein